MAGQTLPLRRASGAAAVACCLALAVALPGCTRGSVRDAEVVVSAARSATVVSATGATRPARDGERLRPGDRVRTGGGGAATLTVRGRRVLLRGDTEVTVPDGASLTVERGGVLVDRRRGPGLTVRAGESRIDEIDPGALRVDRSFAVQIAVYSGRARVRSSSGRALVVPALHQAFASGRALPDAASPLVLVPRDEWERLVIPGVVTLDGELARLAAGIDAGFAGDAARVVPVSLGRLAPNRPVSETVLPQAIGEAAARRGADRDPRAEASRLRAAGGSWGVVAALLDTDIVGVSTALADLLRGVAPTPAPTQPGTGTGTGGSPEPRPGTPPGPSGNPTPGPGTPDRPTPPPTGPPSPSPSPSSPIDDVFEEINRVMPTPTPPAPGGRSVLDVR